MGYLGKTFNFFSHKRIIRFVFRGTYRVRSFLLLGASFLGFSCWDVDWHNHPEWHNRLSHLAIIKFASSETLYFFEEGFSFRLTLDTFTPWVFVIVVGLVVLVFSIFQLIIDTVWGLRLVSKEKFCLGKTREIVLFWVRNCNSNYKIPINAIMPLLNNDSDHMRENNSIYTPN